MRLATYACAAVERACATTGQARARRLDWERARPYVIGAGAGATVVYLLTRRRRHLITDRVVSTTRKGSRRVARTTRAGRMHAVGRTKGFLHRLRRPAPEPVDDVTLAHRVESMVFRNADFPKGQISVNAEDGEVFLRGQVERPELIRDLETAVRKVPGVREVENLLHLPGTPAPASHAGRPAR